MQDFMAMVWLLAAALAFGLASPVPGPAAAQSAAVAPGTAGGGIDCTCRYGGQSYAQNACVCIVTPNGARLACCGKVLNNASWQFTTDMCPTAAKPTPVPAPSTTGAKPQANQGYAALSPVGTR